MIYCDNRRRQKIITLKAIFNNTSQPWINLYFIVLGRTQLLEWGKLINISQRTRRKCLNTTKFRHQVHMASKINNDENDNMFAALSINDKQFWGCFYKTFSKSFKRFSLKKVMYTGNLVLNNNSLKQHGPIYKVNLNPKLARKKTDSRCSCSSWSVKAQDFSQNTSLHGLRYVGDARLHLVER